MAGIMDEFAVALDNFKQAGIKECWEVEFNSAQYRDAAECTTAVPCDGGGTGGYHAPGADQGAGPAGD